MEHVDNNSKQVSDQITYYLGIDVHKKSWTVTIRALGMELKTLSMNPSSKELSKYLRKHYPNGLYSSVYEAGFCGFSVHQTLKAEGIKNIVVHPADVPTTHKEKVTKRDAVDSRKLARELEKGQLQALYVPALEHQQLRSLCRLRRKCSQQITRSKNRIKGFLHCYGIELSESQVSKKWGAAFIREFEDLCVEETASSASLHFMLEELKQHRGRLSAITRQLRSFSVSAGYAETVRFLLTVPGVGFVTAITLVSEIWELDRFCKFDKLCSFFGLIPATNSSGDRDRVLGMTSRTNKYLRHVIIEAAWVAVRKDPGMLQSYNELLPRMRGTDAIVRIARKLLNRIRYVWKNQCEYQLAV